MNEDAVAVRRSPTPPAEAAAWTPIITAILAGGPPSTEQILIVEMVADRLRVFDPGSDSKAVVGASQATLPEDVRLWLSDVAVVVANIDGGVRADGGGSTERDVRDGLPPTLEGKHQVFARTKAARARIGEATTEFLRTVRRIAREPLSAYVNAVTELESRKRQVLREAIGLE